MRDHNDLLKDARTELVKVQMAIENPSVAFRDSTLLSIGHVDGYLAGLAQLLDDVDNAIEEITDNINGTVYNDEADRLTDLEKIIDRYDLK